MEIQPTILKVVIRFYVMTKVEPSSSSNPPSGAISYKRLTSTFRYNILAVITLFVNVFVRPREKGSSTLSISPLLSFIALLWSIAFRTMALVLVDSQIYDTVVTRRVPTASIIKITTFTNTLYISTIEIVRFLTPQSNLFCLSRHKFVEKVGVRAFEPFKVSCVV